MHRAVHSSVSYVDNHMSESNLSYNKAQQGHTRGRGACSKNVAHYFKVTFQTKDRNASS